jgi:hypothetical protein
MRAVFLGTAVVLVAAAAITWRTREQVGQEVARGATSGGH